MSIYTRTGDTGSTSLFGGKRILKSSELVDVYGSIDELNSWIGFIAQQLPIADVQQFLFGIQSDLFAIGSVLAGWKKDLLVLNRWIDKMESTMDLMEQSLPQVKNFILPGGSHLGAQVHITRSICRRVERQVVALAQHESVDPIILKYLNRLSDLLFVLARFINKNENVEEVTWSGIPRPKK